MATTKILSGKVIDGAAAPGAVPVKTVRIRLRKGNYHVIKPLDGQEAIDALIKAGIMTPGGKARKAYS